MNYNLIRYELEKALEEIGKKHGFTSSVGAITYNAAGFHCTLTSTVVDIGNGKSGAQLEYEMYAPKFGIDPKTFGKQFNSNGKTFQIIGINKNARTMPVMAVEVESGTGYKFSAIAAGVHVLIDKRALDKFQVKEE
jgi:hypothetical protein